MEFKKITRVNIFYHQTCKQTFYTVSFCDLVFSPTRYYKIPIAHAFIGQTEKQNIENIWKIWVKKRVNQPFNRAAVPIFNTRCQPWHASRMKAPAVHFKYFHFASSRNFAAIKKCERIVKWSNWYMLWAIRIKLECKKNVIQNNAYKFSKCIHLKSFIFEVTFWIHISNASNWI